MPRQLHYPGTKLSPAKLGLAPSDNPLDHMPKGRSLSWILILRCISIVPARTKEATTTTHRWALTLSHTYV
eukprot:9824646-Karenia_brevis.AAC.1